MTIKKNQSGMTLVEVVISCAIFATAFLGVTMCLSAALRLTNRNMLRDKELNVQQKAIEERTNAGVALSGASIGGDSIIFGGTGAFDKTTGTGKLDGVTKYHAVKSPENADNQYKADARFEIKSMASNRNSLGNARSDFDKASGKYCIHVINNSDKDVDVYVTLASGHFYEASYEHSSSTYSRTLLKREDTAETVGVPSELVIGYKNEATVADGDVEIQWVMAGGSSHTASISASNFTSGGGIKLTIGNSGAGSIEWEV